MHINFCKFPMYYMMVLRSIERFLDTYYKEIRAIDEYSIFFPVFPKFLDHIDDMFNIKVYTDASQQEPVQRAIISFAEGCYLRLESDDDVLYVSVDDNKYTELKHTLQVLRSVHYGNTGYATEVLVSFADNSSVQLLGCDKRHVPNSKEFSKGMRAPPLFDVFEPVNMVFTRVIRPQRPNYMPNFFNDLSERGTRHFNFSLYAPVRVEKSRSEKDIVFSNRDSILANDLWIYMYPREASTGWRDRRWFMKRDQPFSGIVTLRNSGPGYVSFSMNPFLCRHAIFPDNMTPIGTEASFVQILSCHWINRKRQEIKVIMQPEGQTILILIRDKHDGTKRYRYGACTQVSCSLLSDE